MHQLTMLEVLSMDPTGETYGFVERDKSAVTHVATGVLKQAIADASKPFPVTLCMFGDTLARALERGELGVEEAHALTLPEEALNTPAMVGEWGDSHIMLDGAHRVWRRWKRGDLDFPAFYIPEILWRSFVVCDVPGGVEFWDDFNKNAKIRTPEMEALRKALGGL